MSWSPLTFSSRKLHLSYDLLLHSCIAAVQSIVYLNLSCHRQSSLSQLHLFLAYLFFPTQWQTDRLPKPRFPFRRARTSQETQRPKSQSEAAFLFSLKSAGSLSILANHTMLRSGAEYEVQQSLNASGQKLEKSTQMSTTPGQPPWHRARYWVVLAVAMSAFPWCEARSMF